MTLRTIFAASAAALLAGPALASDLPSRKAPPPPPMISPVPVISWSGFYVGVNLGGVFGGNNRTTSGAYIASTTTFAAIENAAQAGATSLVGNNAGGVIGGAQVGYNWQFRPDVVGGFEMDFQGSSLRSSASVSSFAPVTATSGFQTTVSATNRLNYLATLRSRIGYLPNPNWLIYITGGLALGGLSASTTILQQGVAPVALAPGMMAGSLSSVRLGGVLGGGVEYRISPNWSAKVEYLYYNFGYRSYGLGLAAYTAGVGFPGVGVASIAPVASTQFNGNIVRAGVNYQITGAAAPVLARY